MILSMFAALSSLAFRRHRATWMAMLCLGVGFTTSHADAQGTGTPILDFTGGSAVAAGLDYTGGYEFIVSSPITIVGIGIWDEGKDGITPHDVGLWTSGGTPLYSTTIDAFATPVGSTSSDGQWLVVPISPPLKLKPGTYVIGSVILHSDTDRDRDFVSITTVPGVTYVRERQ